MVRLPPAMRDQIRESARHYRRSMNSDIVARLHQTFSGLPGESRADLALHEQIEDLFRRELSEDEQSLIRAYRSMSGKKREALRNLLF
jgi:hypothetical protein